MADILTGRADFSAFEYPEFVEAYNASASSPWLHSEVQMTKDIFDWNNALTDADKSLIGGILRGFTLAELHIGDYWADIVARVFRKPEIVFLARLFSYQESVHAFAYQHLDSCLGLDSYEAFLQDETSQTKIDFIVSNISSQKSLALSLAVFSGFCEGVSLFGSFAILLAYCRTGVMPGLRQIISWSCIDENAHSEAGIRLFNLLVSEKPELRPAQADVHAAAGELARNEMAFLQNAFKHIDSSNCPITLNEALAFVQHRTNLKLKAMGYSPLFAFDDRDCADLCEWFYAETKGTVLQDFFAQAKNGGAYTAKLDIHFDSIDYSVFA